MPIKWIEIKNDYLSFLYKGYRKLKSQIEIANCKFKWRLRKNKYKINRHV